MNLLEKYRSMKNVIISDDKTRLLHLIKYKGLRVDWSDPLMLHARGLVLDDEGKVILHPYDKFFGLNQLDGIYVDPESKKKVCLYDYETRSFSHWQNDSKIAYVTEKIDGSLMTIGYREDYGLIVSSSGNTDPNTKVCSRMLDFVKEIGLDEKIKEHPEMTLICEFYDPESPLVYHYGDDKIIYLHGAREHYNGNLEGDDLVDFTRLKEIGKMFDLEVVKSYDFDNEKDIINFVKKAKNMEGFVVTFQNGIKLKIKSEEYLNLFYGLSLIFNGLTRSTYIDLIEKCFNEEFDDLYSRLNIIDDKDNRIDYVKDMLSKIEDLCNNSINEFDNSKEMLIKMNNDVEYRLEHLKELDSLQRKEMKFLRNHVDPTDNERNQFLKDFLEMNKKNAKEIVNELDKEYNVLTIAR